LSEYSGGDRAKEEVPVPLLQGLRGVRERLGVSVRELAAKSGVSADSISDFEELRSMASPRTARRLAEALGVREEDLK
jgi:transcriptional regulator with XRE-family HTH domain